MKKALRIGKASVTGSFQLFIGKTMSTVILAVEALVVGLFIQEAEYGLYAIALIPAMTMLLFQDWGVNSAMTKYCAQYRAKNKDEDLRKIIVAGLVFEVAMGVFLTVLSILLANSVATTIFGKPKSAFLITLVSISIFSTPLLLAPRAIFVGFERMDLSSYTMICQAAINCILSPLLVFLGYGALGAALGYTFSVLIAGIVAVVLLYMLIFRKLTPSNASKLPVRQTLKSLLRYGVPLAIASILAGILVQFNSFMMASFVDTAMIGNYKIATNFAVLITFLTVPISTVLFPTFSKIDPSNEQDLLKTVFKSSVKYTVLLLVPATLAMIVLSKPIVGTLYGGKWQYAPLFLGLYVVSNLFAAFGNLSVTSLLTGLGQTKMLMKLNMLTISIGIPLALILIPALGITGVILVTVVAGIPSMFIGLYWTWKRYGTKAEFRTSAKIFLASTIAAITTYLFLNIIPATAWVKLTTGVIAFLAIYLTAAPLIGAINQTDIDNLRAMFSGLGIISRILEIPLAIIQKMLKVRSISSNQFSRTKENF